MSATVYGYKAKFEDGDEKRIYSYGRMPFNVAADRLLEMKKKSSPDYSDLELIRVSRFIAEKNDQEIKIEGAQ